jgi:hypothetical protein
MFDCSSNGADEFCQALFSMGIPARSTDCFDCRKIPHSSFAAVQDDNPVFLCG